MTRTELLEHFLKPTDLTVKELIDRNAFAQIMQFAEAYHLEQLPIPSVSGMFINAEYLMGLHPELNIEEAESLKEYANSHTVRYRECYGDGSIMYPQWKEANYR